MATLVSPQFLLTSALAAADRHEPAEFANVLRRLGKDGRTTCKADEIFEVLRALRSAAAAGPSPVMRMASGFALRVTIPAGMGTLGSGFPLPCAPLAASRCTGVSLSDAAQPFEQVTVTNPRTGSHVTVFFDEAGRNELDSFVSCKSWNWLSASLCPVRTGKARHLAADLFLPTTVNQAARVQNIAARIFAVLGALIFDLMTLTLRVMSVVPRAIYNALQPHNGMRAFLLKNGVSAPVLDEGIIRIQQPDRLEGNRLYNLIAFPATRGLAR